MDKERLKRNIPPRPADPRSFPENDSRYWYDEEFAGWQVVKKEPPVSPGDGPEGKQIEVFCPGFHPYWSDYEKGLRKEAERHGLSVMVHYSDWDQDDQTGRFIEVVNRKPDLVILVPAETSGGSECIRYAYGKGVPVIASNQVLANDIYPLVLAWTGPDDWGQQRLLARRFAGALNRPGGYCIVTHRPGTSTYLSRSWAAITELSRIAPDLRLLDMRFTGFNRENSRRLVQEWIDRFGTDLVGIISADDSLPQEGINRAVAERGREDIIRVASGATRRGLGFIRNGTLSAATWQPPEVDGALPVKVAADWFRGLRIEPINYLPVSIITAGNVDSFLAQGLGVEDFHGEDLCRMILEGSLEEVSGFFEDIKARLVNEQIVGDEYFGGFVIELTADIINLAKAKGLDPVALAGGYEMLYKGLFHQVSVARALDWLQSLAVGVVDRLMEGRRLTGSLVDRMLAHIELHYSEPLSLKTLSDHFGLSAAYLGKVFKEQTGHSFSRYLNEFRIGKAQQLFDSGNLKGKDVARDVGYSDANYFYAMFKKIAGTSPSDYCAGCE
jgi:AraC-like DNA-binding protein/ABC-type sugar transport system substrate-binding protein